MTRPTQRDQVKSDEEFSMVNWLNDAVKYGLVRDWQYEPKSFTLFEKQTYEEVVHLKTKDSVKIRHLHAEASYTPDFNIVFTPLGRKALFQIFKQSLQGLTSSVWIDVKGSFSFYQTDERFFSLTLKAMYTKHGIWVKKIIPFYGKGKGENRVYKGLFVDTFAPECDRWKKNRIELNVCGISCKNVIQFIDEVSVKVEQPTLFKKGDK
jgi:hypothetical protein